MAGWTIISAFTLFRQGATKSRGFVGDVGYVGTVSLWVSYVGLWVSYVGLWVSC